MWDEEPKKIIKSPYKNIVRCKECDAIYSPGGWSRGRNIQKGTLPIEFVKHSSVPDNCCPVCLTPQGK